VRRNYRIATAAAWVGWLLVWLQELTYGSVFYDWIVATLIPQAAGLTGLLSVVVVPVLFILSVLESRRLKRPVWPEVLLLAVSACIAAFLWFPAMIRLAGV
jgi:hypothetical protein